MELVEAFLDPPFDPDNVELSPIQMAPRPADQRLRLRYQRWRRSSS
jgi:hypothetical protein